MDDLLADVDEIMELARESGLFTSLCTLSEPAAGGRVPSGTYTDVFGLVDLPCMDAPESMSTGISANEITSLSAISATGNRHVLLDRYYPGCKDWARKGWRATIKSPDLSITVYDLLGSEPDSQCTQTRLRMTKVTV